MLTKKQVEVILALLQRVNLQGAEVPAFVEVTQALNTIKEESNNE